MSGISSQVCQDIKTDAVGRKFERSTCLTLPPALGGALVVWPEMLFPNSHGYESYGENPPSCQQPDPFLQPRAHNRAHGAIIGLVSGPQCFSLQCKLYKNRRKLVVLAGLNK